MLGAAPPTTTHCHPPTCQPTAILLLRVASTARESLIYFPIDIAASLQNHGCPHTATGCREHCERSRKHQEYLFILELMHVQGLLQVRRPVSVSREELGANSTSHRWPVIVGIVVGSLIILSILFCIARCICCGAECACCCFRCCTGCCGGGKRRDGYNEQPPPSYPPGGYNQPYNQPYRSPQPLAYSSPQPQYNARGAQFATFDASKPINEDSLPAMPTWEDATSKKIETTEEPEGHEMDKLDPDGLAPSGAPKLPNFDATPTDEQDAFIGDQQNLVSHGDSSSGYRGSAPAPIQTGTGFGSQAYGGYGGGYAPANQRSPQASPPPQAALGYGNRPGYDRNQSYGSQQRSTRSPPVQGYGQSGPQTQYGAVRNQPSPVYAPSGSTAYDPPINNQQYNAYDQPSNNGGYRAYNQGPASGGYSNQGYGDQGYGASRKAAQGSWRDV